MGLRPVDPALEHHVTDLAGPVVVEDAVGVPEVVVAVLTPFSVTTMINGTSVGVMMPPWACTRVDPPHSGWSSSRR